MTDDLIKELETATEGTRALGDKVLLAHGWIKTTNPSVWQNSQNKPVWSSLRPNPTKSIDDALSLLPEGYKRLDIHAQENGKAWVAIGADGVPVFDNEAATPALALCAAILKAKAHD